MFESFKVCLDSLFNEPNMHLTRYHLYFEALTKISNEHEAQIYRWKIFSFHTILATTLITRNRRLHARARETSLKVNNRLILSRIRGVPGEVDIFKQVT